MAEINPNRFLPEINNIQRNRIAALLAQGRRSGNVDDRRMESALYPQARLYAQQLQRWLGGEMAPPPPADQQTLYAPPTGLEAQAGLADLQAGDQLYPPHQLGRRYLQQFE